MSEKKYSLGEFGLFAFVAPFVFVGLYLLVLPLSLWGAWCEMHIWNWFGAPYFHLAPVTLWLMFGLNIFIGQYQYKSHIKEQKVDWASAFSSAIIGPAIALLVAYIIHVKFS